MAVDFISPLERALRHTREHLFRPFVWRTWFVLGFAAWLARLGSCGGGFNMGNFPGGGAGEDFEEGFEDGFEGAGDWIGQHPGMAALIGGLVLLLILTVVVFALVLMWVRAHGRFVFLDGVVRKSAEIVAPWKRYDRLANSLFLWELVFSLITFAAMLIAAVPVGAVLVSRPESAAPIVVVGLFSGLTIFLLAVAAAYIAYYLVGFVVPIMYREGVTAMPAWGRFMALFRMHPWAFLLFPLLVLVARLVLAVVVFVVGIFTCCIGFLVLMIPYVGTVLLLPAWAFFRAWSLEFLGQFDPRFELEAR